MKNILRHKALIFFVTAFSLLAMACEKKYFPKPPTPPGPKIGVETQLLEASFVTSAPLTLTDAYWKGADFRKVAVTDLNKNALYSNGYLNMTGTYNGLSSFNNGNDPKVLMKAAYDNNKLYIYVEWTDANISPSFAAAFLKGAADPLKTAETTVGWTSQGNSDKVALAFDIANAASAAGTFVDKGCAASCHLGKMQPQTGSVDIWSWDLAASDPLGYATDWVSDAANGLKNDAGTAMTLSNKKIPGDPRSIPAFEWNGVEQSVTRPDGKAVTLDPAYYIINKTPFTGDLAKGELVYENAVYGCNHCHGDEGGGEGPSGEGTAFAAAGFVRKYNRTTLANYAGSSLHTGQSYWAQVPAASVDDLIAYIKGLGGVPGVYLTPPAGSSADIWTVSNVSPKSRIDVSKAHTVYSVLMVRNLTTGNSDDVQFSAPQGKSYPFGIALMDNDGKNHIGSLKQTLTFKPNTP